MDRKKIPVFFTITISECDVLLFLLDSSMTAHFSSHTMGPIWIWSRLWRSKGTSWRAFSRTTPGEAGSRAPRGAPAPPHKHTCSELFIQMKCWESQTIGRSWWKEWGVLESRSDVSFFPLLEFFCQITLINYIYILLLFYQTSFKLGIGVLNFVFCEINKPKYLLVWRRIFSCSLLQSSRSKWV